MGLKLWQDTGGKKDAVASEDNTCVAGNSTLIGSALSVVVVLAAAIVVLFAVGTFSRDRSSADAPDDARDVVNQTVNNSLVEIQAQTAEPSLAPTIETLEPTRIRRNDDCLHALPLTMADSDHDSEDTVHDTLIGASTDFV